MVLLILNAQSIPLPRDTVSVMKVCAKLAVAKNQTPRFWLEPQVLYHQAKTTRQTYIRGLTLGVGLNNKDVIDVTRQDRRL